VLGVLSRDDHPGTTKPIPKRSGVTAKKFEDSEHHSLSFGMPPKVAEPGGTSHVMSVCIIIVLNLRKRTALRKRCGRCGLASFLYSPT
jgi:hypothetical protein